MKVYTIFNNRFKITDPFLNNCYNNCSVIIIKKDANFWEEERTSVPEKKKFTLAYLSNLGFRLDCCFIIDIQFVINTRGKGQHYENFEGIALQCIRVLYPGI